MITECHISWVAMLRPAQLPMPVGYTDDWSVHYNVTPPPFTRTLLEVEPAC